MVTSKPSHVLILVSVIIMSPVLCDTVIVRSPDLGHIDDVHQSASATAKKNGLVHTNRNNFTISTIIT